jgi:hypothetical protein
LLTLEGDIQQEALQLWPNEGGLRIVPDRNEQHTFKTRIRTLGAYCVIDLRNKSPEAGKIRTNKNFKPERGEVNQYILYSDTVHELPAHTFYQLFDGEADLYADFAAQSITPMFYIQQDDTLYGPVAKTAPESPNPAQESAGVLFKLPCPDGSERVILCIEPPVEIKGLNMKQRKAARDLTPFQDKMAIVIFIIMTALLITADKTGLAQWEITTACAVAMYFTGVNTVKESHDAIPISLMMLLVGAYVMSEALVHTGTGMFIGEKIAALLGDNPSTFMLYFMFCLIVIILTQFMNNGATANLFFPIAIMTCEVLGCSAKGLMLAIQNASLIAWFFPTATPIMPLVMESGGYNVKSLMKQGIIPAVLKLITMILWTSYMFPAFK